MKKFFYKTLLVISLTILPYLGFQFWFVSQYDPNYAMLTHKSESIITGLSRGKRISPDILQKELKLSSMGQNLARSNSSTPYGLPYLSFLKRKIETSKDKSLHIVCVSPFAIMDLAGAPKTGREANSPIYQLKEVNSSPNIEYLLNNLSFLLLRRRIQEARKHLKSVPHENGWHEVIPLPGYKKNHIDLEQGFTFSEARISYLEQTISFLKLTGTVYVIRVPISAEMLQIEDLLFSNFNELMEVISKDHTTPYFDYSQTGHLYEFTDIPGHHLVSESAKRFTKKLAEDIKDQTILSAQE